MKKLILLFILIPILELYTIIKAYQAVGFWATLMLLLLTGLIGYYLAKTEGRLVLRNIIKEIRQAHIPGDELLNGFCILIGGLLLLFPGMLSDLMGITLIFPGTRKYWKQYIIRKIEKIISKGYTNIVIKW
ncbi:MAG: FxsA family protein [Tissierellia bacterium]|nr:FxsA family protein [Tissierellia bacterium]